MNDLAFWHVESRAELTALLESADASGPFGLILWEGDYKPLYHFKFGQEYENKGRGTPRARHEFCSNFHGSPVAAIFSFAGRSATDKHECSEHSWEEEVADKVYMLVGKVPPPKK